MNRQLNRRSPSMIRSHLENMVKAQRAMEQPKAELADQKRIAKSDGLNIDALNALLPLLIKYPHDKAAGVLNDLICYAQAFGTELATSEAEAGSGTARDVVSDELVSQPPAANIPSAAEPHRRSAIFAPLRFSTQVLVAISVSIGLIWLLN